MTPAELELDIPESEQTSPPAPEAIEEVFNPPEQSTEAADDAVLEREDPEPASAEPTEVSEESEPPKMSRAAQRIQQEVARSKGLQEQLSALAEKNEAMEKRFQAIMEKMEPETPAPDYDEDPAEHLKHGQGQLSEKVDAILQQQQQDAELRQNQQKERDFAAAFDAEESVYAAEVEDYRPSVQALMKSRTEYWADVIGLNPQQSNQKVIEEFYSVVGAARENGKSAPEALYKLAKMSNFAHAAPAGVSSDPVREVQTLRENVTRSKSLGTRGGSDRKVTLADLADMTESEFAAATDGDKWEELHGAA